MTKENKVLHNKVNAVSKRAQAAANSAATIMDELYYNGPEPVSEAQVRALAVKARRALRNLTIATKMLEKIELGNTVPKGKARRLVLIER
jgi:hypothetical protein